MVPDRLRLPLIPGKSEPGCTGRRVASDTLVSVPGDGGHDRQAAPVLVIARVLRPHLPPLSINSIHARSPGGIGALVR